MQLDLAAKQKGREHEHLQPLHQGVKNEQCQDGAEAGAVPSVGSKGDSYDNAMAETIIGLYKTELIRRRGPWKGIDDVEFAIPSDPIDPEEARYAPRPPRRFTWVRRILAATVVVGLAWIGLAAGWTWSQEQYYVGESDGKVTIYRGLNADLPGISLSTPYETTDVEVDLLPGYAANDVAEGIEVGSLDDAHNTVEKLAERQTTTDTVGG